MSFHAKFINAPNTLVIRTVDTDILGITLFQKLKAWLEVGLTWNNLLCYINANEINQSLAFRLPVFYLVIMLSLGAILLHRLVVNGS